ncbi:hypothetical protein F5H01DRAFT_315835 [Linnemannia elongata]|nr:hypothetical protein F5H01DRAFT_315835 [Linnemannia elongata]
MAEEQTPSFNTNAYGTYNHDNDDGYGDNDDEDMSSSIMSFDEPDLDDIALQIALMAFHFVLDLDIQDDGHEDYDFVHDYEDVYMPDIVESFDEPDQDDVVSQVDLLTMNDAPNEIIRDDSGIPHQILTRLEKIALLAIILVMDNDDDDDYEYVDYADLYMPDMVENYEEPDLDEVAL